MNDEYKSKIDYLMYAIDEIRKNVQLPDGTDMFITFEEFKEQNEGETK